MANFDRNDTAQKIITIVSETLNLDKNNITEESTFEQLGADSLDMLEVVMKLEETFGIEISDEEAAKITSIKEAVTRIHQARTK